MIRDWVTYLDENDKVRAWDVTKVDRSEVTELILGVGFKIVGNVAFHREVDAISYTEQVLL